MAPSNATPPGDTTIVDKDKDQVLDEGRTVKLRSQLFAGEAVCKLNGDAMQCESDNSGWQSANQALQT